MRVWEDLYESHSRELLKYLIRGGVEEQAAQDLVQETFLRALQNAHVIEDLGPSQRRAWLFRTMKNLLYDRYRHQQVEDAYIQALPENGQYLDPGLQEIETELLLQKLAPEDAVLFRMRYQEGYNASELSELFGIPTGTIRARLSRCRQLLKKLVSEE